MSRFSQVGDDGRTVPPFRPNHSKSLGLFLALGAIVAGLLVGGYLLGRPAISKWRYNRDLKQAGKYEREGNMRSAMLTWEQLNRLHPADAEARRRLAGFYERAGQAESITVWKEAIALDEPNPAGYLGLARAAIRFGDHRAAREALAKVKPPSPQPVEYHRLLAALALLEGDVRAQEKNLAELVRLEPGDERVRLNLAMIQVLDPRGSTAADARAALLGLAKGKKVRMRAVVELVDDIARRWPAPTAERDAALRTLAATLAPPRGPLLALPSQLDHIDRLIAYAQSQPEPGAEDVIGLANWMSLNGQTEAALTWIDTLPPRLRENAQLRGAQAEFAIRVRDWERLRRLLLAGAWGAVPTEAVEQAFRARANPAPVGGTAVQSGWAAALEAGRSSPAGLRMLLRLSEIWAWPAEHRLVLQTIARTMPRETWAWRQLISQALGRGDSEQLWQVYHDWRLALPGDPVVQVESAIMGHLLGRRRIAGVTETGELLGLQPGRPGAAVAHALALWRDRRPAEAAAVLDTLPQEAFGEPRYALAGGIILADAGRAAESEILLGRTAGAPLLPEERALVAAARERNTRP